MGMLLRDIAGAVASLTEDDLDVLSEELPTTFLVDQENPPRRAWGGMFSVM
jgi:hypothetical protein